MAKSFTKSIRHILLSAFVFFSISCSKKDHEISLKWNQSYEGDTMEKNITALKWCLSFLGSNLASEKSWNGLQYNDSTITLNVSEVGFSENAIKHLSKLNSQLKETEEYQQNKSIDLGRYVSLTIGSSYHYYRITNMPLKLDSLRKQYSFENSKGYINNSSISEVHRIISFSKENGKGDKQAFISAEIDSITKAVYEFETVEIMPNGQLKFGIYDNKGNLKDAASPEITRAGKPAKCMWCHETGIQPMFRKQDDFKGFLSYQNLQDSLAKFNIDLRAYQEVLWKEEAIKNRALHTELEITYISFMEPSIQHISREWNMSYEETKKRTAHLPTHRHEEFDYLGDLYHRKDIDVIAPWASLKVPESIREKSVDEVNYLAYTIYFDHLLNNLSLSLTEKK